MKGKRIFALVAAILVLAGTGYGFWRWGSSPKESPYVTMPVQRGKCHSSRLFNRDIAGRGDRLGWQPNFRNH